MNAAPLPPAFESLVDEYKADYMAARNLSEKTRIEYETDIRQFLAFLAGVPLSGIEQIAPEHIRGFLAPAIGDVQKKFFAHSPTYYFVTSTVLLKKC